MTRPGFTFRSPRGTMSSENFGGVRMTSPIQVLVLVLMTAPVHMTVKRIGEACPASGAPPYTPPPEAPQDGRERTTTPSTHLGPEVRDTLPRLHHRRFAADDPPPGSCAVYTRNPRATYHPFLSNAKHLLQDGKRVVERARRQ